MLGLSLCSGAGGLDLGLTIAEPGYRTVGHVERDAFAAAVLVARMEEATLAPAPIWDDLGAFDGRAWRGAVDVLLAGYPCQPFSIAGKRRGTDDPRHLWPHVARVIGECQPRFVFLENVPHHLHLGYREVRGELEGLGYRVAEGLFSASGVGAPHRRERLFVLGLADAKGLLGPAVQRRQPDGDAAPLADAPGLGRREAERRQPPQRRPDGQRAALGYPLGAGLAERPGQPGDLGPQQPAPERAGGQSVAGNFREPAFPPGPGDAEGWREYLSWRPDAEPALRRGPDGLAAGLDRPRALRWRVDRLRLCGNGVVPLAAAHAWRTLKARLGV